MYLLALAYISMLKSLALRFPPQQNVYDGACSAKDYSAKRDDDEEELVAANLHLRL